MRMPANKAHFLELAGLPRLAGRGLVAFYRYTLSPLIGPRCRHLPSCSEYADEAIGRFGLWAGGMDSPRPHPAITPGERPGWISCPQVCRALPLVLALALRTWRGLNDEPQS